jgi:PII-like signaling protein
MRLQGPAKRLTILVGETDQWRHRPLYTEIVHRARAAERISAFLPQLDELISEGLVVIDDVEVIAYRGRGATESDR